MSINDAVNTASPPRGGTQYGGSTPLPPTTPFDHLCPLCGSLGETVYIGSKRFAALECRKCYYRWIPTDYEISNARRME